MTLLYVPCFWVVNIGWDDGELRPWHYIRVFNPKSSLGSGGGRTAEVAEFEEEPGDRLAHPNTAKIITHLLHTITTRLVMQVKVNDLYDTFRRLKSIC